MFKRKLLNPPKLKGLSALAASAGIYSYLPFLAVYLGSTVPLLTAVVSGVYGLTQLSDSNLVTEIRVINDGS